MNQTFNLSRFLKLFAKHTADNYKTYLMSVFVLAGIIFLTAGFITYMEGVFLVRAQVLLFMLLILITGGIFSSVVFSDLGDRKKAIVVLALPASHFEKYLVAWLYSYVLFQAAFISLYLGIVVILNMMTEAMSNEKSTEVMSLFSNGEKNYIALFLFAFIHSITFFGSIYFKSLHYIKTAFTFFSALFFITLLNNKVLDLLIEDNVQSSIIFSHINIREGDHFWSIRLPDQQDAIAILLAGVVIVMLWICTFYRLKEKQV